VSLTLAAVSEAVQTNAELARRAYALWNASGLEAFVEQVLAPDIVFYDIPEVPDTGIFRGAEEFVTRMRAIVEPLSRMQFDVRSLEERGDHVLAGVEMSFQGSSSGVALAGPQFHVWRVADGRMHELRVYLDGDQARKEYERLSIQSA
jgi:ketosteroid isomerase-like protein